jgi:hypothetical protein
MDHTCGLMPAIADWWLRRQNRLLSSAVQTEESLFRIASQLLGKGEALKWADSPSRRILPNM